MPETNKSKMIWVVIGLVAVAIVIVILMIRPGTSPQTQATLASDGSKQFSLKIDKSKVLSGPTTMNVKQGDKVVINLTSDTVDEEDLSVEGYDGVTSSLDKGSVAQLGFTATKIGSFNVLARLSEETGQPTVVLAKVVVK